MNLFTKLIQKLMLRDVRAHPNQTHLTENQAKEIAKAALGCDDKLPLSVRFENKTWFIQTMTIGSSRTVVIDDVSEKVLSVENKGLR